MPEFTRRDGEGRGTQGQAQTCSACSFSGVVLRAVDPTLTWRIFCYKPSLRRIGGVLMTPGDLAKACSRLLYFYILGTTIDPLRTDWV